MVEAIRLRTDPLLREIPQPSQGKGLVQRSRQLLRHGALSTLAATSWITDPSSTWLKRNRVQFLFWHHLFKEEEADFRRLLGSLSREYRFIPYSEAVQRIWDGSIDGRYLAVSFDDGLKSGLRAARILGEFGIQACFFLCVSMIGERDPEKIRLFCAEKLHQPPMEFFSWEDVETLLKEGHEIGSHTLTHSRLARLPAEEAATEVRSSFDLLTKRVGPPKHFAWPGGRFSDFSALAAKAVFEAGFVSCASAERGCHCATASPGDLCIRRDFLLPGWPAHHIRYFLARSVRNSRKRRTDWPGAWAGQIREALPSASSS